MAQVTMPSISNELKRLGLVGNGRVQVFATNLAKEMMAPYVPVLNNALRSNARAVDDSTAIEYQTPYAHYQYQGVMYVDPITGKGSFYNPAWGHWSRPGVDKVKSDKPLKYTNPNASSKWDEKMMQNDGDRLIKSIQEFLDRGL